MHRRLYLFLPLILLLSGCIGSEDLMQAPRPATQYQNLQNQIDTLVASGYTQSVPISGDYRQAVVMYDLTGNGTEEAIVFLRNETVNTMTVFTNEDGNYAALPSVVESAESVHSVVFSDFDGDGRQEIVVGWQIAGLRSLSVYTLEGGALTEIFSRPYSSYIVYDIVGEGRESLILIQSGAADQAGVVEMLTVSDGEMSPLEPVSLSRGVGAVLRVKVGPLSDGRPGLLVSSTYYIPDTLVSGEVTDVFTFRDGRLINVSLNMETGVSDALVRTVSIAATDINNDGVLDLPRPIELPRHPDDNETNSDPFYEIHWSTYDSNGLSVETARTYQSSTNSWRLLLPAQWPESYTVRRSIPSAAQTVTTFSIILEGAEPVDFLRIYHMNLSTSDQPQLSGRTVLADQRPLLVTAELIPLKGDLAVHNISETELKSLFKLIPADWKVGV